MIVTVTLNPAVDKTIEIEGFAIGSVNRVSSVRLDAGGKGINVSKVIQSLGGSSRAVAVLAGRSGGFIKEYLDAAGIENHPVYVEGETRTNIKVVDKKNKTNTDINENGPLIPEESLKEAADKFSEGLEAGDVLVLSGSIPKNVDKAIYKTWIEKAKEKGVKAILDADGGRFREGIKAGPYLIKPNIRELEEFFGHELKGTKETVEYAEKLFEYGIEIIVVSLGGDGALFIKKDCAILAHGMKVKVESTVGAGDSMVAALAFAIEQGYCFEETVRLAAACGTASVMTKGTQAAGLDLINELKEKVTIEYINSERVC
ncbi:MAG: 1-phosphofructokinase [Bacillota bacterium]|nr:1-phosphofructokinase [Bacillota bacterium]